jgi:hypothetical protein
MLGPQNSQRPISRRSYLRSSGLLIAGLASGLLTACGAAVPTAGISSTGSGAAAASPAGDVTTTRQATSSAGGAAAPSPAAATSAATTTVAATPSSSTGVAGKQVTIVYVSPDDPGRHEVEQAIFADFTKANPGITVQVTSGGASWTTEQQKLTASIAGGESPNCYVIG